MYVKRKEELIKLIERQVKIEKQVAHSVDKQLEMADCAAAKLLLTEMKFDARKHASILEGILEYIGESDTVLWDKKINSYVDKQVLKEELQKHIEIEKHTLNLTKEEITKTDDEGIKLLLTHIAEDEDRHHKLLKTVVTNSYKLAP